MKLSQNKPMSTSDSSSAGGESSFSSGKNSIAKWVTNPADWNRDEFLSDANSYLLQKNGSIDMAEMHLLGILMTQIEVYIESIKVLQADGLIMGFNNGVTVGPNPYNTIADRALNRILQLMKELELSPKARDGYRSSDGCSQELKAWLKGP